MKNLLLLLTILTLSLYAKDNIRSLQYVGVKVESGKKDLWLLRVKPDECEKIAITPKNLFGGNMVDEKKIPSSCIKKISFVLGSIQPISLDPKIKTVGELEVLDFIKKAQQNKKKYLLVDARKPQWYEYLTIPTSINIPYNEIEYDEDFPKDHQRLLKLLNISKTKSGYDFSNSKKILLFCNGSWCLQSARAVKALVKMGYPKDKLLWYRGGLQDWIGVGLFTNRP